MFTVVRYCVQVFDRPDVPGETRQYRNRGEALTVGQLAAKRATGVAVYEVVGEPVQDLWREPRLLAQHGSVPRRR